MLKRRLLYGIMQVQELSPIQSIQSIQSKRSWSQATREAAGYNAQTSQKVT
ncbi:hypothetical protein [Mogibacterium timidum]|uniref:hypothetical protein n=1 Tax=Mogibacterium timidum TaxID=35519 RepID=UPI0028D54D1E|nr:hypothetical protein [Mogibacterium timidum]